MNVMGVDPGKKGAFVVLKNGHFSLGETFPTDHMGEICFRKLCNRMQAMSLTLDVVFVEKVGAMAGWGARSLFNFGRNYQMALDAVAYIDRPRIDVPPKEWQATLFTKADHIRKYPDQKNKALDRKKMALIKAKELFPKQDFLATERSRIPHDGIVDATLIAYHGYLKLKESTITTKGNHQWISLK